MMSLFDIGGSGGLSIMSLFSANLSCLRIIQFLTGDQEFDYKTERYEYLIDRGEMTAFEMVKQNNLVEFAMDKLRLRRSVGLVTTEQHIEFFKSNIRESILLKMSNPNVVSILQNFDGNTNIEQICERYPKISIIQLEKLLSYLHQEHILIQQDISHPLEFIQSKIRLVNLLEDYCFSTSEVVKKITDLGNKSNDYWSGGCWKFCSNTISPIRCEKFYFCR